MARRLPARDVMLSLVWVLLLWSFWRDVKHWRRPLIPMVFDFCCDVDVMYVG